MLDQLRARAAQTAPEIGEQTLCFREFGKGYEKGLWPGVSLAAAAQHLQGPDQGQAGGETETQEDQPGSDEDDDDVEEEEEEEDVSGNDTH